MVNHPNRGRERNAASNPTPAEVLAAREANGHTQVEAAAVIYSNRRAWQEWETERTATTGRSMHPALFELYAIKTAKNVKAAVEIARAGIAGREIST